MAAPPPPEQEDQLRDWGQLPHELVHECLAQLDQPADKRAALATSTAFAIELVRSSGLTVTLDVEREEPFAVLARLLQSVAGSPAQTPPSDREGQQEQRDQQGVTLVVQSDSGSSPRRCLAELRAPGVPPLACVTRLELQGLTLDSLIPDGVDLVLPNLRRLSISDCMLTDAAPDVNTACPHLQHLELKGVWGCDPEMTPLSPASLPKLSSVSLLDNSCPTTFLTTLGSQITSLHLDSSYRTTADDGDLVPSAAWRATLQRVAQCMQLQSLTIPCATSKELALVAPALQRLERLHLNYGDDVEAEGDATMELLLGLPHLTSLHWEVCLKHSLRRSYAEHACRWKELSFHFISLYHLARLPLRSLTSPVRWQTIVLWRPTSVAEGRAASANAARAGAGFKWHGAEGWINPTLEFPSPCGATTEDTPAAILRALQPLFAGLTDLAIAGLDWDAELVKVLAEVLPRSCVYLCLGRGKLLPQAAEQMASSLPWLEVFELGELPIAPETVSVFVKGAVECAKAQGQAAPKLRWLRLVRPVPPEGADKEAWKHSCHKLREQAQGLLPGLEVEVRL